MRRLQAYWGLVAQFPAPLWGVAGTPSEIREPFPASLLASGA